MEYIRRAIERAADGRTAGADQWGGYDTNRVVRFPKTASVHAEVVPLRLAHLESMRVIGHDPSDSRTRSFDMLRTQVLQAMDLKHHQFLAVTSPTPGCGKTLTSVNLALSIARQAERSVLLVDLDLQKPQVSSYLGVRTGIGVMDVLEDRVPLLEAVTSVGIGASRLLVLPNESPNRHSSEWMASSAMRILLQEIKRELDAWIVILDMPPMLSGDDVIAVLPQIDCVLLVTAVGLTTIAQIEESGQHLQSSDVVRIVLNKATDDNSPYYY